MVVKIIVYLEHVYAESIFLIMCLFHMLNMVELFCLGKSGIAKCKYSIEQVKCFVVEKS